jgi:hypothetical protein
MYNFIFWFFYKYFEWRDKDKSPLLGASVVGFTVTIHFFALYSITRYFYGRTIAIFSKNYAYNKLLMLPFALLFFFLLYILHYKKKADEILEKFSERKPFTVKNIILVVVVIVVPLIFGIKMTNLAIKVGH